MIIKRTVGTTIGEIEKRKFGIFVPISLGNKWFTEENIKKYIVWALAYSKGDLPVIIADELHQINIEVKDHFKPEIAKRKVERISKQKEKEIEDIIKKLNDIERGRIIVLRWSNINKSDNYLRLKNEIYSEFNNNEAFRKTIIDITLGSIEKMKNRKFKEQEILKLSGYVLDELPILLHGMEYRGHLYNLHPYPVFTKISTLVENIQRGEFKSFYERIGKPSAAIVELQIT